MPTSRNHATAVLIGSRVLQHRFIVEVENEGEMRSGPCLSDDELQQLREIGRRIEKHYGKPQDIEWAFDEVGNLFLLQSRPETVWAMKDAKKPVAEPKDNPLAHVMGIFSGGKR